ncbi:hypothetical protein AX17_007530 [Amanita inopinata Kibby_2008]|nr:hypothetical protein AX17_007530 [Amanita inopinata Kibby_2008]
MLIYQWKTLDILFTFALLWIIAKLVFRRPSSRSVPLRGPKSKSLLFGMSKELRDAEDRSAIYESWATEYGPAFNVPSAFSKKRMFICDPKAISHFYSKETYTYVKLKFSRIFIERLVSKNHLTGGGENMCLSRTPSLVQFGRGIIWAEGDSHKRQRKALSPAFSNAEIRNLTRVFYDSSYKLKARWDAEFESGKDEAVIEVQYWLNRVSLDSVGIAGFGHDFETLADKRTPVADAFDSFGTVLQGESALSKTVFLLGPFFPFLLYLPTARGRLFQGLRRAMSEIADELLERARREKQGQIMSGMAEDKSIIGTLVRAESSQTQTQLQLSHDEIMAQMNVLILAGYETTSISLTWALIELSLNPEKQQKLRDELARFSSLDPTWDQLTSGLPYLDGVVQEVLRLHPAVPEIITIAAEDDVMPFSTPVTTTTGDKLTSLPIPKGTVVTVPIALINRSEAFWGPDAKQFIPERWLGDLPAPVKNLTGHRHLYTFSDGPRICLGRGFALAEMKAVLSVLIRNYVFELPAGPATKFGLHPSILQRPKVADETGPKVPLRVMRVEE